MVIAEEVLAKVDVIAGDRQKRSTVIEKAVREFIAREEAKGVVTTKVDVIAAKKK